MENVSLYVVVCNEVIKPTAGYRQRVSNVAAPQDKGKFCFPTAGKVKKFYIRVSSLSKPEFRYFKYGLRPV